MHLQFTDVFAVDVQFPFHLAVLSKVPPGMENGFDGRLTILPHHGTVIPFGTDELLLLGLGFSYC